MEKWRKDRVTLYPGGPDVALDTARQKDECGTSAAMPPVHLHPSGWCVVGQAIRDWPSTLRLVVLMVIAALCLVMAGLELHFDGIDVPTMLSTLRG